MWLSQWIISRRLELTRESYAAAVGRRLGRGRPEKGAGSDAGGLTGASVCAGLGGVTKGPQIGLHGFGRAWGGELSGDSGGLHSPRRRMYAGCADRGPPDGSE